MLKARTKSKLLSQPFEKPGNRECNRKGLLLLVNVAPICSSNGVKKIEHTASVSSLITTLLRLAV